MSGQGGTVYVSGLPLAAVSSTMRQVELTEIAVFSAALVLTGLIGTGWVRLSLRPLRRVTATAAEVTELPLASGRVDLPHRVPDADPRTEVGQLGTAFNRMLGHVESALARRHASEARLRSFAADASHELRTPLAAIRGYAELAQRYRGTLPPEVEHALSRVESESARMSELVEDLLLLARLDAGRPLESWPVDLSRLAIDATSDARAAGPGHRWQLELPDGPVQVRGDEQRLHQVLANLLSNARTHTPAGDDRHRRGAPRRRRHRRAERDRRRSRHTAGAAARHLRAVRQGRQLQVPRGGQHRPWPLDRGGGHRRPPRDRDREQPARAYPVHDHAAAGEQPTAIAAPRLSQPT